MLDCSCINFAHQFPCMTWSIHAVFSTDLISQPKAFDVYSTCLKPFVLTIVAEQQQFSSDGIKKAQRKSQCAHIYFCLLRKFISHVTAWRRRDTCLSDYSMQKLHLIISREPL